jgi:hypothetical protein
VGGRLRTNVSRAHPRRQYSDTTLRCNVHGCCRLPGASEVTRETSNNEWSDGMSTRNLLEEDMLVIAKRQAPGRVSSQ